jgi:hypothetical protein
MYVFDLWDNEKSPYRTHGFIQMFLLFDTVQIALHRNDPLRQRKKFATTLPKNGRETTLIYANSRSPD